MAERACLNCGETPTSIKRQRIVLCGSVEGYETPELTEEWPRHRWADWRDADLAGFGVKPEAYDRHRRTRTMTFQWIACEDTIRGHVLSDGSDEDREMYSAVAGQCIACGKKNAATPPENREEQTP
jgi:hypothetical protein